MLDDHPLRQRHDYQHFLVGVPNDGWYLGDQNQPLRSVYEGFQTYCAQPYSIPAAPWQMITLHSANACIHWDDEERLLPPARAAFLSRHDHAERPEDELAAAAAEALQERISDPTARGPAGAALPVSYAAAIMRQREVLDGLAAAAAEPGSTLAGLPDADRRRVEAVLLEGGMRNTLTSTPDTLMRAWGRMVHATEERPHRLTYEEHLNWLDTRDRLGRTVAVITPGVADGLFRELGELDRRFLASTCASAEPLRRNDPWRPLAWWWYRLPPEPSRLFADYMEKVAKISAP